MIASMKSNEPKTLDEMSAEWLRDSSPDGKALWAEIQNGLQPKRFKEAFAKAVSEKRMELGLTQRQLAKLTGINQRDISHIEQAKANPTLSTQVKLLTTLGLKLEITAQ